MAQPKPEDKTTLDQVLELVDQLTPEEGEKLLDQLKLEDLRRAIQVGIDQADKGEVMDGKEVFIQMRERNASFRQKGNQ